MSRRNEVSRLANHLDDATPIDDRFLRLSSIGRFEVMTPQEIFEKEKKEKKDRALAARLAMLKKEADEEDEKDERVPEVAVLKRRKEDVKKVSVEKKRKMGTKKAMTDVKEQKEEKPVNGRTHKHLSRSIPLEQSINGTERKIATVVGEKKKGTKRKLAISKVANQKKKKPRPQSGTIRPR